MTVLSCAKRNINDLSPELSTGDTNALIMKLKKDFGYWAGDPRVKNEIEPYLQALEALTYYAIRGV